MEDYEGRKETLQSKRRVQLIYAAFNPTSFFTTYTSYLHSSHLTITLEPSSS